jgi:hypothetical protein
MFDRIAVQSQKPNFLKFGRLHLSHPGCSKPLQTDLIQEHGQTLSLYRPMNLDLHDKTVLITGGLGALAKHILKKLDNAGATLIVTDRETPGAAQPILLRWGLAGTRYFQMDVTSPESVELAVKRSFAAHPNINVALGHAGGTGICLFEASEQSAFDQIVAFNFFGQTYFARRCLAATTRWTPADPGAAGVASALNPVTDGGFDPPTGYADEDGFVTAMVQDSREKDRRV